MGRQRQAQGLEHLVGATGALWAGLQAHDQDLDSCTPRLYRQALNEGPQIVGL
jgi:hypothetical protein